MVCKTIMHGCDSHLRLRTVNAVLWYTYKKGKKRSWTVEQLEEAVKQSFSFRQVIEKLGLIPAGGNYAQLHKYIKEHGFDTSHFKGKAWNKGLTGIGKPIVPLEKILVRNYPFQSYMLKLRLLTAKLKPRHCEQCGWEKISEDGRLPLELHHVNGNSADNRLENLMILCPNCHSLTSTYRGRNRKTSRGGETGSTHET
ncbi:MAG: hypothetical protein COT71_01525 [Candidatus Andersenbacteria bacterium CG10_big_fil_rev_8_21_14_0_10_54_11]|uniref:HNH nuclease domain-containing protein n=1 Tax=Candidatus Andersenbacteria bacterium CG10_big_fil_rev_8_21_14_0_10_54_11 TaxID=1974485 RepID=A0A2M6WZV1_9BACT|nr:MAG: hypothetical protein COT71_01525 [Candidatus Andersenbacteria bacterium CG10_big_fil_rev_8_21_14_0_10_54_11]